MDISLLTTTRDPEQLRTLAIAMVQKVKAENAGLLDRMRILEEQMKLSLQQRDRIERNTHQALSWPRTIITYEASACLALITIILSLYEFHFL